MNGPSHSRSEPQTPPEQAPVTLPQPYRSTPVFDEISLPAALRSAHSLKAGTWGRICVIEGQLKLTYCDTHAQVLLSPEVSGLIQPQQLHFVEPLGPIKMRIDFFDTQPDG